METAWELSTGQRNNDMVAGFKIVRATNDSAWLGFADVNRAPVDRLVVAVGFGFPSQNFANHERSGDTAGDYLLDFQIECG